ncbi:hypothetical protein HHL16_01500 [Pseudoflavitalea sp. G-6-1-2]|uniref:hypothetical protein n=1 Tax=Pseudoflavitalea sp. G-6-1-2 TaxID=2728841 RepID=UPI00146B15B3|nr:hypothetical protein [Pseudoflavitalea sp. G-6-1-2]NML19523.1 hypothetical protein [Pseudoflavitalea sp. G-6-1-2]
MKKISSLVLFSLIAITAFSQKPSKEQMEADRKKFTEAQKQLEAQKASMSPEARKALEDMMEKMGANKAMQNAQQGLGTNNGRMLRGEDPNIIPDNISALKVAVTPQNKSQLTTYLSSMFAEADKLIKPENKSSVKGLMNHAEKTGKYAMIFWANNELDKALYLLLNTCISNADDMVSLNNLASLLTISGYAHKSLPLLLYAQKLLPNSGTLANNTGQAWLSLGNVEKAKPLLIAATEKDTANSEAYRSLALIAQKQGNSTLCASYLAKAIAHGGATSQNINLLQKLTPDADISSIYFAIRNTFKKYYKDHSITKRFIIPEIPDSYEAAVAAYSDINNFFLNLDATIQAAGKTSKELNKQYEKSLMDNMNKRMAKMQQITANVGKPGAAKMVQDMKSGLSSPFIAQAALMLNAIDNPRFSVSYISRMKKESENRLKSENELKEALKTDFDNKINALTKEQGKIEGGEGRAAENSRLMEIERELCQLRTERQTKWLKKSAEINNKYIRAMEDLMNQRLQEYLFWNTIVMQSLQDPTSVNFAAYTGYLNNLNGFRSFFPFYKDGTFGKPCGDYLKKGINSKGQIQVWEREHCEVDFGFDAKVVGGKFNCEGLKMYVDAKAGEFTYSQNYDPVTWETTGHSLSAKAGKDKEFEITKNIGGKIGASVETTIKFDGNMNPVDLIVTGSAGAEINDGALGRASADLGSVTISVNGGFNSAGPGFTSFGSSFLKN